MGWRCRKLPKWLLLDGPRNGDYVQSAADAPDYAMPSMADWLPWYHQGEPYVMQWQGAAT
jgi:hypothetical protein